MCSDMNRVAFRVSHWAALTVALVCLAAPAAAQYKPRTLDDPATGEKYHIEGGADFWFPTADMVVESEQLGIPGSKIDLKRDLGLPVNSTLEWKTYEFAYEFDFVVKNWGFVGFDLEAKYTDVQVQLASPIASEFARARGPIPAIGGIGRYYFVPNISVTGELTAFKIPDSIDDRYNAHYIDLDIYGTVNFTNNIGVKGGYRSRDVGYLIKTDTGSLTLKGIYIGAVVRY